MTWDQIQRILNVGADVWVWIFCFLGSIVFLWILNNRDVFIQLAVTIIKIKKEESK